LCTLLTTAADDNAAVDAHMTTNNANAQAAGCLGPTLAEQGFRIART
jgi:hypothetical protein